MITAPELKFCPATIKFFPLFVILAMVGMTVTATHAQNSDVLPFGSVAVQFTNPVGLVLPLGRSNLCVNVASPLPLVLTPSVPTDTGIAPVCSWPCPSQLLPKKN